MPSTAIVQTAFIGDVVLATPLFEAARISMPDDRIIAVVRSGCENLLGNNPYVDEIIVWDKRGRDSGIAGVLRLGSRLRERKVDIAIIPHRSLRTALALRLSGAHTRIGFAKGGGALFHTIRVPYCQGIHEVDRNLTLAAVAGWEVKTYKPAIFPDDTDSAAVDKIVSDMDPYCVLAPGSVWMTKRWPVESYGKVGSYFAANGVKSVAELYGRAEFVLTGDTAPQHIAAAMGSWVFSLFGPTVREFGFWPYSERGVVIEESVTCRPCGIHGHQKCPEGTHICMKSITCEKVIDIICKTIEV